MGRHFNTNTQTLATKVLVSLYLVTSSIMETVQLNKHSMTVTVTVTVALELLRNLRLTQALAQSAGLPFG
jgi:hypothetical protein